MEKWEKPKKWHSVIGKSLRVVDNVVIFDPKSTDRPKPLGPGKSGKAPIVSVAMCNLVFGAGKLSMDVEFGQGVKECNVAAVLYFNPGSEACLTAGLGRNNGVANVFVAHYVPPNLNSKEVGWQNLGNRQSSIGDISGRYRLDIEVTGTNVLVKVDGISILRTVIPFTIPTTQCGVYCEGDGSAKVYEFKVDAKRRKAFVIMQFTSPFNELYAEVIKPVIEDLGLEVVRADEVAGPGLIVNDITRLIGESDVIIADVTPQNENVFYELGYAHGLAKDTILIADRNKKLPFDVSPFRTLFYDNSIVGKKHFCDGLTRHMNAILNRMS